MKNTGLSRPLPPLETLRETFLYDPETGALAWRVSRPNGVQAGASAGCPNGQGYVQVKINGRRLKAHRIAWALHHGADPGPALVDHVDRDRSNNRASNLRLVDAAGNRSNSAQGLRPVQVIAPDGSTRRFPSTEAAAAALGCSRRSVYRYAQGLRAHPAGLTVAYA